jgi:hypothetical protein
MDDLEANASEGELTVTLAVPEDGQRDPLPHTGLDSTILAIGIGLAAVGAVCVAAGREMRARTLRRIPHREPASPLPPVPTS